MYDYLKTKDWEKQRARVLERDRHTCQICGRKNGAMNVHHICYEHPLESIDDCWLVTLCPACHKRVHDVQAAMKEYAEQEMPRLKKVWAEVMASKINKFFPHGIKNKSKAIAIMRHTFYSQSNPLWAIRPDYGVLVKKVKKLSI